MDFWTLVLFTALNSWPVAIMVSTWLVTRMMAKK
jgi:hypothetical protein